MSGAEIIGEAIGAVVDAISENNPKAGCFILILAAIVIGLLIWLL